MRVLKIVERRGDQLWSMCSGSKYMVEYRPGRVAVPIIGTLGLYAFDPDQRAMLRVSWIRYCSPPYEAWYAEATGATPVKRMAMPAYNRAIKRYWQCIVREEPVPHFCVVGAMPEVLLCSTIRLDQHIPWDELFEEVTWDH